MKAMVVSVLGLMMLSGCGGKSEQARLAEIEAAAEEAAYAENRANESDSPNTAVVDYGMKAAHLNALLRSARESGVDELQITYRKITGDNAGGERWRKEREEKDAASAKHEAWVKSLDADEEYYDRIKAREARANELNAKLRKLKEEADAAEREARIAEIEAR